MENVVQSILGNLDLAINGAGQAMFTTTMGSIGPIVQTLMALLIVMIGLNMSLNVYRISMRESWQLVVRLCLILVFAFSWTNFEAFYLALTNLTGSMALQFFKTAGSTLGTTNPSAAMDTFGANMATTVDSVAQAQGSIMRGVTAALLYFMLGLLLAAYVLVVAFSKIMIAILLGIAPIAISATLFEKTKNLFEAWLSAFVAYAIYPVAAAGVLGTVATVAKTAFVGSDNVSTIGDIVTFIVVAIVGAYSLKSIPQVATQITGQMNLASFAPEALKMVGKTVGLHPSNGPSGAASNGLIQRHITNPAKEFAHGAAFGNTIAGRAASISEASAKRGRSASDSGQKARDAFLLRARQYMKTPSDD